MSTNVQLVYVDYALKEFMETSNNGVIISGEPYKTIHFAYDITLLGNNGKELQNAVHQMHKILKDKCDIIINKENTEVI